MKLGNRSTSPAKSVNQSSRPADSDAEEPTRYEQLFQIFPENIPVVYERGVILGTHLAPLPKQFATSPQVYIY